MEFRSYSTVSADLDADVAVTLRHELSNVLLHLPFVLPIRVTVNRGGFPTFAAEQLV